MTHRVPATSPRAQRAHQLVCELQQRFVAQLDAISARFGDNRAYAPFEWLRDAGRHGGGVRYMATDSRVYNRASVNTSQVQYDDDAAKALASASAISTIIHPVNPLAPSVHIHISWTEMKTGSGYWRMMADLNPSIPYEADTAQFKQCLQQAAGVHYAEGAAQGDRYFNIPVLGRTRGVTHFYLENYSSGDFEADFALAHQLGCAAIDTYIKLLDNALATRTAPTPADAAQQLAYHTLYFFQVLTLDRGTTSGLLVHDENDVGILASLPAHIDRDLLASWQNKMPEPQDKLLASMVACLAQAQPCPVEDETKRALAQALRNHYRAHPAAIDMQASGYSTPPTVANHR